MSATTPRRHEVSIAFDGYSLFGKEFGTVDDMRGLNQAKIEEALMRGVDCLREVGLQPTRSGGVLFAQTSAETAEGYAYELRVRCAELRLPLTVGWGWVEGVREATPVPEVGAAQTD